MLGMIIDHVTMTTVDVTTTPDVDTTGDGGTPTVVHFAANLPMVASVPVAVLISLVLVGLICAVVLILACLLHKKRLEKRYITHNFLLVW